MKQSYIEMNMNTQTLSAFQVEFFQLQLGIFLDNQVPLACALSYDEKEDENWPRCFDEHGNEQFGLYALDEEEIFHHAVEQGKILTARSVIDKLDGVFESLSTHTLDSLNQVICDTLNHYVPFASQTTHSEKVEQLNFTLKDDHGFDGELEESSYPYFGNMNKKEIFCLGEEEGKTLVSREIIDNLEIILHQIEETTNNNNQNPDNTHQGKKIKP